MAIEIRNRNIVVFTTISQAQERVNHYEHRYGGFQRIRIYGHKKTFQLSVGLIDYASYLTNPWIKRKITGKELYHIKNTVDQSIHPVHSNPMTSVEADRILKVLSSFIQVKVADRVKGHIKKNIPEIGCEFIICNTQTFPPPQLGRFDQNFQNPFIASCEKGLVEGRMQGYLRGWDVYNYDDVRINRGWGMNQNMARLTVCYRGNQLGVAVRWKTGETLKSMYHH